MRLFVFLAVLLGGFVFAQRKPAGKPDPVVGAWRMDDGRVLRFRENGTAAIWTPAKKGLLEGKWEHDPFSEAIRRYAIRWEINQAYDLELARDFSAIRGTKKNGGDVSALRLDELQVYLWANAIADIAVNGVVFMSARFPQVRTGDILVRSGDVITVDLTGKGGVTEFALEIFKDNRPFLTAGNFYYTKAAAPDWRTSPDLFGYRAPLTKAKKDFALGSVKEPLRALPQAEDGRFKRFHFKYVVK